MAFAENTPRVAYRGFVSYSHKDAGIGRTIHRRLEGYRLPKHLIGSETTLGAVPARLTPIFRDREELSAGESLSDQVQAALTASECLIVLCSPDAKASKWVAKEIETFRALHPERPVLAALIAGEPDEAFPEALTAGGAEPIAADFRKQGDGQRLALLKLVAGMTGVSLDALVQRDAQRRLRGVMAITGGAIIALLILSALLIVALRARAEADRQRAEAEGLVEYMLTDLRDKLKGVGSLKVMAAVNDRAMKYYGGQGDLSRLSPESLDRRARVLLAMGEDDEKQGSHGKALKKFVEAHRTTAAVLAKRPNSSDAIFAHAQSEFWVGFSAWAVADKRTALRHWRGYLDMATKLSEAEPMEPRSATELGYAHGNLCDYYLNRRDLILAEAECAAAIEYIRRAHSLTPRNTEIMQALANRYGWMAEVQMERRAFDRTLQYRELERATMDWLLLRDPTNFEFRVRRLWPELGKGRVMIELGRKREAAEILRAAKSEVLQLMDADPKNHEVTELNGKIAHWSSVANADVISSSLKFDTRNQGHFEEGDMQ